MPIRIENERNPEKVLCLATSAWRSILSIALDYGWNPLGAVPPEVGLLAPLSEISMDSYFPSDPNGHQDRIVLLEDALNLADALELAFQDYQPRWVPASYFLFETEDAAVRDRPGVGTLLAVADFCYQGAFAVRVRRLLPSGALEI